MAEEQNKIEQNNNEQQFVQKTEPTMFFEDIPHYPQLKVDKIYGGFPVYTVAKTKQLQGETYCKNIGGVKQLCTYIDGEEICTPTSTKVRVYLSGNQLMDSGSHTEEIEFDTESFDTNSEFDTTGHRFTATSAGYYSVSVVANFDAGLGGDGGIHIYKNGASYSFVRMAPDKYGASITDIVYLDGVDDYVEAFVFWDNAGNGNLLGGATKTSMSIYKL